jgi:hypothetical protein
MATSTWVSAIGVMVVGGLAGLLASQVTEAPGGKAAPEVWPEERTPAAPTSAVGSRGLPAETRARQPLVASTPLARQRYEMYRRQRLLAEDSDLAGASASASPMLSKKKAARAEIDADLLPEEAVPGAKKERKAARKPVREREPVREPLRAPEPVEPAREEAERERARQEGQARQEQQRAEADRGEARERVRNHEQAIRERHQELEKIGKGGSW